MNLTREIAKRERLVFSAITEEAKDVIDIVRNAGGELSDIAVGPASDEGEDGLEDYNEPQDKCTDVK